MKGLARSPFWRRALRAAGLKAFHFAENNNDSRPAQNGEVWLLRQLILSRMAQRRPGPLVIFDVGANVGDYTRSALREARRANCPIDVHAFEPSPHNVDILRRAFVTEQNVQVICVAVAEHPGEAILYSVKSGSSQASLVKRSTFETNASEDIKVSVLRLDEYIAKHSLTRIDLLKLDIEGAELAALRGLGQQLQPEMVEFIQFEYGGTALDAGTTLRDFYQLLSERGYVIAKLLPRALELRPYGTWMEHYAYANYIALSPQSLQTRDRII